MNVQFLFQKTGNARLVVFRIFFGLLMMVECWGAIATGWVKETFVDVNFTFNFIGFDWTQFLVGEPMYYLYIIMGFLGLLMMLGAFYRTSAIAFFALWTLTYFMQKSHYNNHYYLLVWVSFLMTLMPANNYFSIDCKMNHRVKRKPVYHWHYLVFQVLIACVYVYAAIAKFTKGWTEHHFLPLRLKNSARWFEGELGENVFSEFLKNQDLAEFLAYAGIGFDFLIVPFLIFKPTRKWAFGAAFIFHIFNSITLQIGIFPYFALALCIFFFSDDEINRWFLRSKNKSHLHSEYDEISPLKKQITTSFVLAFSVLMIGLPLRHHFIKDDVLWTEEGHRMSWRMMLRTKSGRGSFYVETPDGKQKRVQLSKYLKPHQMHGIKTKPDVIWQFAQRLKKEYKAQGIEPIKVFYKHSKARINDGKYFKFIDPKVDLANEKWNYFGHQDWIFPSPEDYYK